jgi:hypothetical protein
MGCSWDAHTNLYVPHFQATVKSRLRYVLVDTACGRLVDYLNLATSQNVDLTATVADSGCGTSYIAVYSAVVCGAPIFPPAFLGGVDPHETYGVRLQVDVSTGVAFSPDWTSSLPDPLYGRDKDKGVNRFLFQFGLGWGQAQPGEPPFQVLNAFAARFSPFRTIHAIIVWQANDPLVHYTVGDLQNLRDFPSPLYLDQTLPPIPSTPYGYVTRRYEPWGGNPTGGSLSPTEYDLRVKDPVARRVGSPDDWDFPTDRGTNWLGRMHRGTPWQTVYLKAPAIDLSTWVTWTGNNLLVTNYGQLAPELPQWFYATNMPWGIKPTQVAYDSAFAQPTSDWRLASMLASLRSAKDSRQPLSANQASLPDWLGTLDGMVVLTNNEGAMPPDGLASLVMSSNSPQAAAIAAAILNVRAGQPNQLFQDPGDVPSTPELSIASPWLNTNNADMRYASLTDEAYEAIPAQLLPLLRADSVASVLQSGGTLQIQFSGSDGLAYAVQVSTDLVHWTSLATNCPVGGRFTLLEIPAPGAPRRFYRSALLP